MSQTQLPSVRDYRPLLRTLGMAILAWAVLALQIVALFFRPSPYGGPYAADWSTYLFHALGFRALTVWGVALPFFGWWIWHAHRARSGRQESPWVHATLAGLLVFLVAFDHADNEVMRFMGTHLTADFLRTYGSAGLSQVETIQSLVTDQGGALSSVTILILGPVLFLGGLQWWWRRSAWARLPRPGILLLTSCLPLLGGLVLYNLPGGRFRRDRVQAQP